MILRHARVAEAGQDIENTFEAMDERSGAILGSCSIELRSLPELFPARPARVCLNIAGDPAPDALLGAAVARAKELGRQAQGACRVFTKVDPGDAERMASLAALGFRDSDGLVRMRCELPGSADPTPPAGCVVVKDDLDDPMEQKFFLERYNRLYNESLGFDWLMGYRAREGFMRLLIVAPTGMAGEIVAWQAGDAGVVGWLQTARKWRRMGVARCLLALACREFANRNLTRAEAEIQARVPNLLKLMECSGFRQDKLLLRYPGIDMD